MVVMGTNTLLDKAWPGRGGRGNCAAEAGLEEAVVGVQVQAGWMRLWMGDGRGKGHV